MYFIIGCLACIVKQLGQTKDRKAALTMGLGIVMRKSLRMLRLTKVKRQGCCRPSLRRGRWGG